ncbi:MAG: alpha/beta hydrolase [Rhodospirillum sp.]|nr:alpha/beta hydrolase [Rhodospirillum sp.]MCF8491232.1 alpha/beta hydrolase [Rhodospirillum sp.]MCF8502733.1 alpha/beta hydrolase [Rhodospirillum sp.]
MTDRDLEIGNQGTLATEDLDLDIGGIRLKARWLTPNGVDTGPVLVFLHEGLGCIRMWKDFPERLCRATGLRGFLYERQGFGGSDPIPVGPRPLDYLHTEGEQVLPQVLDQVGIRPRQHILIGHSDGGTIALLFAAARPMEPLAAITEAAHVFVEDVTIAGVLEAKTAWETTNLRDRLAHYHGENVDGAFHGWNTTWLTPPFKGWTMVDELPAIRCPLLVIQGEEDEYGTQMQVEEILRWSSGPAEGLMVPNCAHVPHLQAKDSVLGAMGEFIDRVLRQG